MRSQSFRQLHVIYDYEGWAQYNRALALQKYAPEEWIVTIGRDLPEADVDAIFLLVHGHLSRVIEGMQNQNSCAQLIVSFNSGGGRGEDLLLQCLEQADHTIVVNRETWNRVSHRQNVSLVKNGFSSEIFSNQIPTCNRSRKVLWSGSKHHAEHKGYSLMRSLVPELEKLGFEVDLRLVDSFAPRYSPSEMAEWYNSGSIYVIASLNEGVPNNILEAAACGTAVVSTPVGVAPELIRDGINGVLVDRNPEAILAGIIRADQTAEQLTSQLAQDVKKYEWSLHANRFFDVFNKVCQQDVVLTSYFTLVPDPQRNIHAETDCHENMKLAKSCQQLGLQCIVFHDNLSEQFCYEYPGITFVRTQCDSSLSCNDFRFFVYRDWLLDHHYRNVWTCDLFDVVLAKNPNKLQTRNRLWIGSHSNRSTDSPWFSQKWIETYGESIPHLNGKPLLMAGTWGGDYLQVTRMLDLLTKELLSSSTYNSDMPAFNKIAYEHFSPGKDMITCVEPLVSRFKEYETDRQDVCFIHK